jgi:hypothetical protein
MKSHLIQYECSETEISSKDSFIDKAMLERIRDFFFDKNREYNTHQNVRTYRLLCIDKCFS